VLTLIPRLRGHGHQRHTYNQSQFQLNIDGQ
jgi:hypothetical protein